MGSPPKGKRTKALSIRVSEVEAQRLEELAAHEGLTVSAYIRRLAYSSPPPPKPSPKGRGSRS